MTGPEAAAAYAALYGPTAGVLARSMGDIADALHALLCELAVRPTTERANAAGVALEGASLAIKQLRAALLREGEPQRPGAQDEGDGR